MSGKESHISSTMVTALGFGGVVFIVLTLWLDVRMYQHVQKQIEIDHAQKNIYNTVEVMRRFEVHLNFMLASHRDFRLTGDETHFRRFVESHTLAQHDLEALHQLLSAVAEEALILETLETLVSKTFAALRTRNDRGHAPDGLPDNEIAFTDSVRVVFQEIQTLLTEIYRIEERRLNQIEEQSHASAYQNFAAAILGNVLAILLSATSIVLLNHHIKRRTQMAEALRQAKNLAEAANQAKSEFLANMNHELRTPLNGILGYTQILAQDATLKQSQQRAIQIMHQSGEHLLTLINDILDLSKIEAGKVELQAAEFPLPTSLSILVDLMRVRAAQKGIAFRYDEAPDIPDVVLGDEKRLRQVLLNLLSNAVKFTDQGQVTLTIRRMAAPASRELADRRAWRSVCVRFEVADTGVGVAPDKLQEIFEPFKQVGNPQAQIEGTGLGLTISQRIVRLMGSELHVQSRPGEGSVFWFDLTLPEVVTTLPHSTASGRKIMGFTVLDGATDDGARRILIVDEHPASRAILHAMLCPLGFELKEAASGQEALEITTAWHPHAILLDLILPGMTGYDVTRRVKASPESRATIILAVSADSLPDAQQQFVAAGGDDFLTKPVQFDRLLEKLGVHLHLEWRDAALMTSPVDNAAAGVLPPTELLEQLADSIAIGDIGAVQHWSQQVAQQHPETQGFTKKVRDLAEHFQIAELHALIASALRSAPEQRCPDSPWLDHQEHPLAPEMIPTETELQELLRVTVIHSVSGLRDVLTRLNAQNPHYRSFLAPIEKWTAVFEFDAIHAYVTSYSKATVQESSHA